MLAKWTKTSIHTTTTGSAKFPIESLDFERFDTSRPLTFMHIPKTAGTCLSAAFGETIGAGPTVAGFDLSQFASNTDFSTFSDQERRRIVMSASLLPPTNFVFGHFSLTTLASAYPNSQLVTVLREPMSRILSHWLYWRQFDDDALKPYGTAGNRVRHARNNLQDFLQKRDIACQTDNLIVRMLLWPN